MHVMPPATSAVTGYSRYTMIYEIRHIDGNKLAEFSLAAQVAYFLRKQFDSQLQVWVFSARPNLDLKGILTRDEFLKRCSRSPQNHAYQKGKSQMTTMVSAR